MKRLSLLFAIISSLTIEAQNSSYCYNNGIAILQSEEIAGTEKTIQEGSIILMSYVMNVKEALCIMTEKNNSEINVLLKKIKRAENTKHIGFAAIPAGLLGALSFAGTKNSAADINTSRNAQQGVGFGLLALSAMCLSTSYYFKTQRAKNYKKAIAKYNQLYN